MTGLYYIAADENGCPYIAHSEEPRNHKYILKIQVNGQNRYFYTKAEIDAYYNRQKRGKEIKSGPSQHSSSSRHLPQHGPAHQSMSSRNQPQYESSLFGDARLRSNYKSAKRDLKEAQSIDVPKRRSNMDMIDDLDEYFDEQKKRKEKERKVAMAQKRLDRAKNVLDENRTVDDILRNLVDVGKKVTIDRTWQR